MISDLIAKLLNTITTLLLLLLLLLFMMILTNITVANILLRSSLGEK